MMDIELHKLTLMLESKLDRLEGKIENLEEKIDNRIIFVEKQLEGHCIDTEQTNLLVEEHDEILRDAMKFQERLLSVEARTTKVEKDLQDHKDELIKSKAGVIDNLLKSFGNAISVIIGGGAAAVIFWAITQYIHSTGGK